MSSLKKSLERINKIVGLYEAKANDYDTGSSKEKVKANTLGGCIFHIDTIKIHFAGFFEDECSSLGGSFTEEPCNDENQICYRGTVENNGAFGSLNNYSKADEIDNRPYRYPNQGRFDKAFDENGLEIVSPMSWFGGGNDFGDPYLGWHPMCRIYLGRPVNKNSKLKGKNGKVKLFACGSPPLEFPEGEVPIPIINIWIDTRDLEITENRWPLPGTHVIPGLQGPPFDGGVWRGFRPAGAVINPEFIKFIQQKAPQCITNICNGGLSGFMSVLRDNPDAAVSNLVHRCSLIKQDVCKGNKDFEDFIERNFPSIVSGGSGIKECEKAICGFVSKYIDHIAEGNQNVFSWRENYGPVAFDPRNMCPILTGVGELSPVQQEVKDKCSGAKDFIANLYSTTQRGLFPASGPLSHEGTRPFPNSLEDGCYNCLVYMNPETLQWLSPDFPWPKSQEEQMDLMYKLVEKGYNTDWICDQGCYFSWLCSIPNP